MKTGDTLTTDITLRPDSEYGMAFWRKRGVTRVRYTCIGVDCAGRTKYRVDALIPHTGYVHTLWRHYTRCAPNTPQTTVIVELTAADRCALMVTQYEDDTWDRMQQARADEAAGKDYRQR